MGIQYDPTITLGTILAGLGTITAVIVAAWKFGKKLNKIAWMVKLMWLDYKEDHKIRDNGNTNDDLQ